MKKTVRTFISLIKENLITLLSFEFIFRFTIAVAIIPESVNILNYILDKAGVMYITGSNVISVLKNPLVIVVGVILLLLILCVSIYEINCVAVCYEYCIRKKHIRLYEMFTAGYSRMHKMLENNAFFAARWMLLALPAFNIHFLAIAVNRVYVLGKITKVIFRFRPGRMIILLIVILSMAVIAFTVFRFGNRIFGFNTKKTTSLKETFRLFFSSVTGCILLNIIITAILAAVYAVVVLIGTLCLRIFTSPDLALVRLMKFESTLYWFIAFLAGALGMTFNVAMIFTFNYDNADTGRYSVVPSGAASRSSKRKIFGVLMSVLVCAVMVVDIAAIVNYMRNGSHFVEDILKSTTVTAHRGGANFAPENTMDAVNYSISAGADYIEIDVQLTADNEVIVLHDDNLKRTTGFNGYPYKMNYSEIVKLDAGSYFSSDFSEAYIPTFEEVLAACKGKININIELKKTGSFGNQLPDQVMQLISDYQMEQQCVITSTTYSYLRYIKKIMPQLRTGFIANMLVCDPNMMEYADFFSLKYSAVNQNFVNQAHKAGKEIHVWTVNTRLLMNRMKAIDVDSIITDNPILCQKILAQKTQGKKFIDMLQTLLSK
ncbi:MAG: glycerophosphodiester phosphodiesterase family protein [Oscillospiraceae bacterium]|nr:glycerophosphodiester phosphodiesterase family protein [Oscillospiraceae bacterium]